LFRKGSLKNDYSDVGAIMIRVILASYDPSTPFDPREQTFRVNVELSTYYHEQKNSSRMVNFGYFFKKFWRANEGKVLNEGNYLDVLKRNGDDLDLTR